MQNLLKNIKYKRAVITLSHDLDVGCLIEEVFGIKNIFEIFQSAIGEGVINKTDQGEILFMYYGTKITDKTEYLNGMERDSIFGNEQPFLIASIQSFKEFDISKEYVIKIFAVPSSSHEDQDENVRIENLLPAKKTMVHSYIVQIEGKPKNNNQISEKYIAKLMLYCMKWNYVNHCTLIEM